jgi:hypothetical protein
VKALVFVWALALVGLAVACCGGPDANALCPGAYWAKDPNPDPKNSAIPCEAASPSPSPS